jgi:hypothetical protein
MNKSKRNGTGLTSGWIALEWKEVTSRASAIKLRAATLTAFMVPNLEACKFHEVQVLGETKREGALQNGLVATGHAVIILLSCSSEQKASPVRLLSVQGAWQHHTPAKKRGKVSGEGFWHRPNSETQEGSFRTHL